MMPKTENVRTTVLAEAFDRCGIRYEAEGNREWFDLLMLQTDCVTEPFEVFARKMARYIYVVRK